MSAPGIRTDARVTSKALVIASGKDYRYSSAECALKHFSTVSSRAVK